MLRTGHAIVSGFDSVLGDTLKLAQTLGILLTALVAVNFVIFTPSVQASAVLEDRVDRDTVVRAYQGSSEPLPDIVHATLDDLDKLSVPRSRTTAVEGAVVPTTGLSQVTAAAVELGAGAPAGTPYPLPDLCARGADVVNDLVPGACAPLPRADVPLYERVLLSEDLKASPRLTSQGMREAAARMANSAVIRASVTLVNTGRATAQNVTVVPPDGYAAKPEQHPTILFGQRATMKFETFPGAPTTEMGAVIENPTFQPRWDPGAIDVGTVTFIFWVFVGLLVAAIVIKIVDRVLGFVVQRRDQAAAVKRT